MESPETYDIKRDAAADVFFWHNLAIGMFVLFYLWIFSHSSGLGVTALAIGGAAILIIFGLCSLLLGRAQSKKLRYWLDGSVLRIEEGVVVVRKKAIPLERITDLELRQGPLLAFCGIWVLRVQTAGSSGKNGAAEASLYGLSSPEEVRDQLLAARGALRES
jgi:putative membrane protein